MAKHLKTFLYAKMTQTQTAMLCAKVRSSSINAIWYQVSHTSQQIILLDEGECKHMQCFSFSSTIISKWLTSGNVLYSCVPYCSCFFEEIKVGKEECSNLTKFVNSQYVQRIRSFGQVKEWLNLIHMKSQECHKWLRAQLFLFCFAQLSGTSVNTPPCYEK